MHNSLPDFYPLYAIPILVALLLSLVFPVAGHITDASQRRQYYLIQVIMLFSAIAGAKLVFLFGDLGWPIRAVDDWAEVLYTGRSIVGALIFGLLGAELAKPLLNYSLPPNDRFAALLPFTIAIGRIGCLLNGCCRGVATDGPLAIHYSDGVARHPAQAYEIIFHITAGLAAIVLIRKQRFRGNVFSLYLISYGVFRFLTEFVRETPRLFGPLSSYQWLSLFMAVLGTGFLVKRTYFPSEKWRAYFANPSESAA